MADRIISMRALLKKNLEDLGSKHDWSHITSQVSRLDSDDSGVLMRARRLGCSPTQV